MQRILPLFFFLFAVFIVPVEAHAFRFSPFRAKFEPTGAKANNTFLVENNTDEPASVQIRITTREVDANGIEQNQLPNRNHHS